MWGNSLNLSALLQKDHPVFSPINLKSTLAFPECWTPSSAPMLCSRWCREAGLSWGWRRWASWRCHEPSTLWRGRSSCCHAYFNFFDMLIDWIAEWLLFVTIYWWLYLRATDNLKHNFNIILHQ
jgi:hypothetical protein